MFLNVPCLCSLCQPEYSALDPPSHSGLKASFLVTMPTTLIGHPCNVGYPFHCEGKRAETVTVSQSTGKIHVCVKLEKYV